MDTYRYPRPRPLDRPPVPTRPPMPPPRLVAGRGMDDEIAARACVACGLSLGYATIFYEEPAGTSCYHADCVRRYHQRRR